MLPSGFVLPDPRRLEPLAPVRTTIDEAAAPHPWAVKADHGAWVIVVKSYSGPESRKLAERLAADIRQTHKVASYLFERNAEERRAEVAQVDAIRKRELERYQPTFAVIEQAKKEAAATGSAYIDDPVKLKIPKPYHETPEQWAVVIAGFPDMTAANKALETVKKLPAPKDTSLCDTAMIGGQEKTAKSGDEWKSAVNYLNPYACAMAVPNPALGKARMDEKGKLDPFVVGLNKGVENSLLGAKKPWTILVKTYSAPMVVEGRDGGGGNVFRKTFGGKGSSGSDILRATAAEADLLAKALRHPNHKPRPYDAFVLHHTVGSLVTVGEFDGPNDPDLLRTAEELRGITYEPRDKDQKPVLGPDGRPQVLRLFDGASAFPVPKY
jgi:hypothetical protein